MSDKIKLRVPSKPAAEYISQGNLSVTLVPKGVVTVTDRHFADWLIREHALAEIDGDEQENATTAAPTPDAAGGKK